MSLHRQHIDNRSKAPSSAQGAPQHRGASVVEFAIIMPILMVMLMGIVQIGLATYRLQGIHAASRDAARVGSLHLVEQDKIRATALASLESTLLVSPPVITVDPDVDIPCASATRVVVTIVAASPYSLPFMAEKTLTLTSRAEFACEV